jgi:hypothetical protein
MSEFNRDRSASTQKLLDRIAELESHIAKLEQQKELSGAWLNDRIAELEAENLAFAKDSNLVAAENQRLREAAQAVVDSATPHYDRWVNGVTRICINRLKALLGGGDE